MTAYVRSESDLEQAAFVLLAPPNVVTPEQRHEAENLFLSFRKSQMPYALCRNIMETSNNDYVIFQAAATIKESVVREWSLLAPTDIEALRSFLLQYVIKNVGLQNYVREQVLQAVAVIFKRASLDSNVVDKEALFSEVTQLIASGDLSLQLIACSILTSLLNEFSSTSRTSSVGLTWEFHSKCKIQFEQKDLKRVFEFCLQVLHELEKSSPPLSRELMAVFNRMLAITEHVLGWNFIPKHIPKRIIGTFLTNQSVSFKPPVTWKEMILDKEFINMMFRIHKMIRYNSEMAHHSLQCLAQLATLNGPVFEDDKAKTAYLNNYILAFLELVMNNQLQDFEALGVASIISNLVMFFQVERFLELDRQLMDTFIQNMARLTCQFGQAAALEETMQKDDTLYQEAYEKVLDSWMSFSTDTSGFPKEILQPHAQDIFNSYLRCHLAPPDGTRNQCLDGSVREENEEYEEEEADDRLKFEDQLRSVGTFGRLLAEHTIPLLAKLLEERVWRLHGQLKRMSQHGPQDILHMNMSLINTLNEDIHWLLLLSAHVLTDENLGETPMVPDIIMKLCIGQTEKIDLSTTLKVLASPGNRIQDIPGAEQNTDPVVRLVSAVFRLCEVENRAISNNLLPCLSPQVASSSMWFLKRWVVSYLLPNENYYPELSSALTTAFGRDSEGGMWTVGYLMDKIVCNLQVWNSEVGVGTDTVKLLVSMVEKRERAMFVVKCPAFLKLAKDYAAHVHPYDILPPLISRFLCQALVMAGSASFDGSLTKEEYWNTVLESIHSRFKSILENPNLKKEAQKEEYKLEICSLLESCVGVAGATLSTNASLVFQFLYPALVESVHILDLYHSFDDIVMLVLELFKQTSGQVLCFLDKNDSGRMYQCSLNMIQAYTKYNIGLHVGKHEEEEQYSDLCVLMDMLTNLLSKDFIVFGPEESGDVANINVDVVDVVLYSVNFLVPLIKPELLKFPLLCSSYMKLLTYLAEVYPEKVCVLPDDLLKALLEAIDYGLTSLVSDIVKLCLEFVSFVAIHICEKKMQGTPIHTAMEHFLKLVFDMVVVDTFDMDLLDTACHTFFTLICCHQEKYEAIVRDLMSKQPEHYERLADAFNKLTPPGTHLVINRQNRIQFMQNFEQFLSNVRGFLCVR